MKKSLLTAFALSVIYSSTFSQTEIKRGIDKVIEGKLIKITEPLRDFKVDPNEKLIKSMDEKGKLIDDDNDSIILFQKQDAHELNDPNCIDQSGNFLGQGINQNFEGFEYSFTNPPDPTICVGRNHIIVMSNRDVGAQFKVYDKTGHVLQEAIPLKYLTGYYGMGDPITLYDQLDDRYILTEVSNPGGNNNSWGIIFAISATNDPMGSWYVYFFSTGTVLNDYEKFSIWPGGFFATSNEYWNNTYLGGAVYAFDRKGMLYGNTNVLLLQFNMGTNLKYKSMAPVTWQGYAFPENLNSGLYAYIFDNTWGSSPPYDAVGLMEFIPDFAVPNNSVIQTIATLQTTPFNSLICPSVPGNCILNPSGFNLTSSQGWVMQQPVYRNFEGSQGIVLTNIVNVGASVAGVRWYELRKQGSAWSIFQQGTFSPDNTFRFMPSICYDSRGNIGLAYNVSSPTIWPGIRYTGRKVCDPLNQMTIPETVIIDGTSDNDGNIYHRFGDYNHLVPDPVDNSFWFHSMYFTGGRWHTRIANFSIDDCASGICSSPSGLWEDLSQSVYGYVGLFWSGPTGATFSVDYKKTSDAVWTNATTSTSLNYIVITGLLPNTSYDWRVSADCSGIPSSLSYGQFFTYTTCNAPQNPVVQQVLSSSVTLHWDAVIDALSYLLQYKKTSDLTWTDVPYSLGTTTYTLTNLTYNTTYEWRVRTQCNNGYFSDYSVGPNFTTTTCDPPQNLHTPYVTPSSAILAWDGVIDGMAYLIQYKRTVDGSWTDVPYETVATTYELTGLRSNTSYQYRIRTHCYNNYFSDYSLNSFETPSSGSKYVITEEQTIPNPHFKVVPIPASKSITAKIETVYAANGILSVFDAAGKIIYNQKIHKESGKKTFTIDVTNWSNGMYFLTVKFINGNFYSQKIVILH